MEPVQHFRNAIHTDPFSRSEFRGLSGRPSRSAAKVQNVASSKHGTDAPNLLESEGGHRIYQLIVGSREPRISLIGFERQKPSTSGCR